MLNQNAKKYLLFGSIFMTIAVAFGAFGAHGLKEMIPEKALQTYHTGITYQFYHAIGLLILGIIQQIDSKTNYEKVFRFMVGGILLFSFNCYVYAITGIKTMALIVPIGGIFFILAWGTLTYYLTKKVA